MNNEKMFFPKANLKRKTKIKSFQSFLQVNQLNPNPFFKFESLFFNQNLFSNRASMSDLTNVETKLSIFVEPTERRLPACNEFSRRSENELVIIIVDNARITTVIHLAINFAAFEFESSVFFSVLMVAVDSSDDVVVGACVGHITTHTVYIASPLAMVCNHAVPFAIKVELPVLKPTIVMTSHSNHSFSSWAGELELMVETVYPGIFESGF